LLLGSRLAVVVLAVARAAVVMACPAGLLQRHPLAPRCSPSSFPHFLLAAWWSPCPQRPHQRRAAVVAARRAAAVTVMTVVAAPVRMRARRRRAMIMWRPSRASGAWGSGCGAPLEERLHHQQLQRVQLQHQHHQQQQQPQQGLEALLLLRTATITSPACFGQIHGRPRPRLPVSAAIEAAETPTCVVSSG
jgi:hypothetical protein